MKEGEERIFRAGCAIAQNNKIHGQMRTIKTYNINYINVANLIN